MNVLFLTLATIDNLNDRGIYTDLLRQFCKQGHNVCVVTPNERRVKRKTEIKIVKNSKILSVRTLNLQKTNFLEKGVGTLLLESQYLKAIKAYFSNIKFDLVLYSTPPITFSKVITYIKKRDQAYAYLLLKDIFPQNAVDLGLIRERSLLHKFFQNKEKKLYEVSDTIGCMSKANKQFILKNNPYLGDNKVEVNPNTIEPIVYKKLSNDQKRDIREKHGLPEHKKIFIYGGNLGKPQGIDFLLETISFSKNEDAYFLIVGSGTERDKVQRWFRTNKPANGRLMDFLDKKEYDELVKACDIGLIFLHKDFTIPNFPSRLLSYLEMGLPVIAATDPNTDIGEIIEANNCGFWVRSGDRDGILKIITQFTEDKLNLNQMEKDALSLLMNEYHVSKSYKLIESKLQNV